MKTEKLPFTVDVERLGKEYLVNTRELSPIFQSPGFGGWAITSSNGDWRDGWAKGLSHAADTHNEQIAKQQQYTKPTVLYTGYVKEVIEKIAEMGFMPARVRYSTLIPLSRSPLHSDSLNGSYARRIHIPLITNPEAQYFTLTGSEHLAADGSVYFVDTMQYHQVFNRSVRERRTHLIMTVWDTKGVTKTGIFKGDYFK